MPLIKSAPEDGPSRSPIKRTIANSLLLGLLYVLLDIVLPIIVPDHVAKSVLIFIGSVLLVGIVLMALGTITKNRWGINTKPVNCPACGFPMPRTRQPKSLSQALWGDGICDKCGCEMDKWGRLITPTR